MKASCRQRKATTSSGTKNGLGCNKSDCVKTTKQKRKITGKVSSDVGGQLLTSIQSLQPNIQEMQTSFQDTAPGDLNPERGHCQDSVGKVKLQLFPIDEITRKGLEKDYHNPFLELTLTTRKRISSVVKHLNNKWGSSKMASVELMLFPYNACLDNLVHSRRWTLKDSDITAADVHASLGSPAIFHLRYGWFSNLEQTGRQASTTTVFSNNLKPNNYCDKNDTNDNEVHCPVSRKEHGPCHVDVSTNQQVQLETPFLLGKTIQNEVDQSNKSANTSWVDCLSNMSFGAILSEVTETPTNNLCHALPAQNSVLQQIPITCDSFDAAIASFMAHQQPTNPSNQMSILEAEETCHAFPFAKVTSSSHDPASSRDASVVVRCNNMLSSQVEQESLSNVCPVAATNLELHTASDGCPEPQSGLQSHSQDGREELNTHPKFRTEVSLDHNNQFGGVDFSWPDSFGPLEHIAPCSSERNDNGETIGLSGLIASSMDAFQNFSIL